ncbi:diguanylate phosphodiesterase [Thermocrinis sp.]|jgi:c-di-GMP-related signal transduction protein|uniref:diguanylate phosphodiesterase n=1 Tax=Thermocrinis sp. TaxID=2024383 RepID=UPI0026145BAF|nr:diguanylate phosphodiesterase [Thermocrinis sp.]
MEERVKKLKAEMVLEHIVDLKMQQLFGYKVLSRIVMDSEKELRFQDIKDESLKKRAESSVLKGVAKLSRDKKIFINMPVSIHIESLPLYGRNFVVCIPADLSSDTLAKILLSIKNLKLKSALDDFYIAKYGVEEEAEEVKLGAFDFVFIKEEFYMNSSKSDVAKAVSYAKSFGAKVIFKKIDTYKKVQLAIDCGADYGHGYFFGYETYNIPLE